MAGICSRHFTYEEDCTACNSTPADLFGEAEWAYMRAEAEAAGLYTCDCGFEYFMTVSACPLCNKERKIIIP